MARGFNTVLVTLDAGQNQPIAPASGLANPLDPGTVERLYLQWIEINVVSTGAGGAQLTDGQGGQLVAQIDTSVPFNSVYRNYVGAMRNFPGRAMTAGNLLYANVVGGRVTFEIGYEVK